MPREETAMMGTKARVFGSLPTGTLEDCIPPDHFYRTLKRTLDLRFARDLVRDAYAETGRPSIDPVVFFKLAVPVRPEHMKPTRFGNMMANLEDHPSAILGMNYFLWWPRLAPLL